MATFTCSNHQMAGILVDILFVIILFIYFIYLFNLFIYFIYLFYLLAILFIYYLFQSTVVMDLLDYTLTTDNS